MNLQELRQLQADRNALERLLQQLPEESVIERMGLESRKKEIEEALASHPALTREPVRAKLTFRGKPVVGSHGVLVKFGAQAVAGFHEAVHAIGVAGDRPLGAAGQLPNADDYRLLITEKATGSFGFVLEEAPKDGALLFPESSPLAAAIEQARSIMEATTGSDDDLTDAIAEIDPRALTNLRSFLKTMADAEAMCTLVFNERKFCFADVGQVRRSEARLSAENIREEERTLAGHFQGVLPKQRTFEFLVESDKEVLRGKVGSEIQDAGDINEIVYKPAQVQVRSRCVGNGRPRYVLLSYEVSSQL